MACPATSGGSSARPLMNALSASRSLASSLILLCVGLEIRGYRLSSARERAAWADLGRVERRDGTHVCSCSTQLPHGSCRSHFICIINAGCGAGCWPRLGARSLRRTGTNLAPETELASLDVDPVPGPRGRGRDSASVRHCASHWR
jgi:hypothetical protein